MSKIDYDNLLNPVGSVNHTAYGYKGVDGRSFNYSGNNPVVGQIEDLLTSGHYNPEQIGDLYEKAHQWEIDQANWLDQLKVQEALKLEQREYDSPEAQMLRMRQAGINPDLAGYQGSGSGSGSGGSVAAPERQSTPTGRTDPYAQEHLILEGVNTAINGISAFINGYGVIADSISKFRMLPSQIKLNESAAGLNDAQANEINTLLSGKKKSIDLSNSLQYVGLVSDLSGMIKNDASDEEFNALVSAAGIDPAHAASTIAAIKQAQSTPEFLQNYKKNILADRQAQAELDVYTSEVFNNLVEEQLQLQELELDFSIVKQSMANKVQTFLQNSPGYLENLADIQTQSASLSADQLELAKDQFRRDLSAYQQCLDDLVGGVKQLESRNEELMQRAKDNNRPLTPQEQLEYDSNLLRIDKMYSLGSQEVAAVYNLLGDANRQRYYLEANSHYNKKTGRFDALAGSGLSDETIIYGNIAFGDIVRGAYTTHDLIGQYANIAMQGVSIGAQFFMGSRLGRTSLGRGINAQGIRKPASQLSGKNSDWLNNPNEFGL